LDVLVAFAEFFLLVSDRLLHKVWLWGNGIRCGLLLGEGALAFWVGVLVYHAD
jgi:hypothetical protein